MTIRSKAVNLDRVGAVASGICAVHCVLTALIFGLLPSLGFSFLGNPLFDRLFLGVAFMIGSAALITGFRRHRKFGPSILFGLGAFLLGMSHFVLAHDHSHGGAAHFEGSHIVSALGGISLVAFHLWNNRLSHLRCRCGEPGCEVQIEG